jgi:hypothetical protein
MGGTSGSAGGGMAGTAGSASGMGGTAGSAAGSAGNGGSAGSSSCEGPTGTTCATASSWCSGYAYATGDLVTEVCTVGTAGCIVGWTMLFECVSACGAHTPATIVDNQYWRIEGQCPSQ